MIIFLLPALVFHSIACCVTPLYQGFHGIFTSNSEGYYTNNKMKRLLYLFFFFSFTLPLSAQEVLPNLIPPGLLVLYAVFFSLDKKIKLKQNLVAFNVSTRTQ